MTRQYLSSRRTETALTLPDLQVAMPADLAMKLITVVLLETKIEPKQRQR